jgi:hypothetical protein
VSFLRLSAFGLGLEQDQSVIMKRDGVRVRNDELNITIQPDTIQVTLLDEQIEVEIN